MQKPYISKTKFWEVLNSDGKVVFATTIYTLAETYFHANYEKLIRGYYHNLYREKGENTTRG